MACKHYLLVCATLACFYFLSAVAQDSQQSRSPRTRFSCTGRGSGYYADINTGCQVYHMCDGLGRQFSYTCPNTTLFQQRMLICDHWYMVNCSMSERDYSANLLIGQRDKPFVSDEEMRFRTPRPDILNVPVNSNYYDGLREAESKFPVHPGNSIVGVADSISSANNNGLDSAKQNYRPPSSWSTGTGQRPRPSISTGSNNEDEDELTGAASQRPLPTFQPSANADLTQNTGLPVYVTAPSQELVPPFTPTTEVSSEEFQIDARMKQEDPVFKFIKRFDPNSPDSHKTSMTKSEILKLNEQLPAGQSSAEERHDRQEDDRSPRKHKNIGHDFNNNRLTNDNKNFDEPSRFDTVNIKPTPSEASVATPDSSLNQVGTPNRELVPPKSEFSQQPSTTNGPPIYYDWKWAAPAFDLEPPKENNATNGSGTQEQRNLSGRSPFSDVTRPTPADMDPVPPTKNTEYNISSYFVPDYMFPLDKPHPGYDDDNAETSFQVKVARPGRVSYGENPACPHCHPAYLNPGTCEPCIVKR